jgi:hypothetical protein
MTKTAIAPSLVEDRWATRAHAHAAAATLRSHSWEASVEESGPVGAREYRVIVTDGANVAYFYQGDKLDDFQPRWI